jgi:actin-related protein
MLVERIFETYGFGAVNVSIQAMLTLYAQVLLISPSRSGPLLSLTASISLYTRPAIVILIFSGAHDRSCRGYW